MVILTAIGFLLILIMLLTIIIRPQPRNDWRISQIDRKLDMILQQLDIDRMDTSLESVRSQLAREKSKSSTYSSSKNLSLRRSF